jgi:hypothetical protein
MAGKPLYVTNPPHRTPLSLAERIKWADARVIAARQKVKRHPDDRSYQAALDARRQEAAALRALRPLQQVPQQLPVTRNKRLP